MSIAASSHYSLHGGRRRVGPIGNAVWIILHLLNCLQSCSVHALFMFFSIEINKLTALVTQIPKGPFAAS